ncbi:hypothetical protein [Paenibacillus ginsengihumi]|uniref:hypothetical protein n=1 Tax=Paenibacillus ginsengihumi TaxID=431596 RepID=UPI000372A186|nr:hypothetical protein [Paenibacillus ginsengihumi]
MATIILMLCLVVLGALFSVAFVLFFQGKKAQGTLWIALFALAMVLFYWSIAQGYLVLPEQA